MLNFWVERRDVHDLSARANRLSSGRSGRQNRWALLAVDSLENRITPSHLTIFSARLPSGLAPIREQAPGSTSSRAGHEGESSGAVKRHVAHKVVHTGSHGASPIWKRHPVAFPVRLGNAPINATAAAIAGTTSNAATKAGGPNSRKVSGFRGDMTPTASDRQTVDFLTTQPLANSAVDKGAVGAAETVTHTAAPGAIEQPTSGMTSEPAAAELVFVAPLSATAGFSLNGTLTARDEYGNTVTGFGGNVTLTSNDGLPVHEAAQTAFTIGTEVLAVTINTPDTVKLQPAPQSVGGTVEFGDLSP